MWPFLLAGLAGLGLLWWLCNWRYLHLYWTIGSRYTALPFLGQAHHFLGSREKMLSVLLTVGDHALANGGISTAWFLHRFYLMLADTEDASYVLKNHLEKDEIMKTFRDFTRTSHLFATLDIWRPRKKIVKNLLSSKIVSNYEPVFAEQSAVLVQRLRGHAGRGDFSIWNYFNAYTMDSACNAVLGIDHQSQIELNDPFRHALNSMLDLAAEGMMLIWYHVKFLRIRHPIYKQFLQIDKVVKEHMEQAIKKHEKEVSLNTEKMDTLDEDQPVSILHMFTQLKKQGVIDYEALYDESLALLIASLETAAVALSLVAVTLAHRYDVQEKVYQELTEVFEDSKRQITKDDLPRLKYLEAVIKETLRLHTPVPHITRKALVDMTLPSGAKVPKGTNFLISFYALHRNPKYWGADADHFRPERFLDGSVPEQAVLFAFSHGPRGCPGTQFATMSMKTALSSLLRQYRLLPAASVQPLRPLFGISMMDAGGFQVRIQDRKSHI